DSVVDTLYVENIGTGPVDFDIDIEYVYDKSRQSILCVDRDGSSSVVGFTDDWAYFEAALIAAGYTDYVYHEVTDLTQDGPDLATMQLYDVIIWFSGEVWGYYGHDCMTDNDEINLAAYLDGGGTLFLSAQDYFWASYPSAGSFSAGQFPYDYLGMRIVTQDNWIIELPDSASIEGCAGSLAEGYNFFVQDIYTTDKEGLFIDWLTDHVGQDMFNITSPTPEGICGIQYDAMTFRTVFTAASFAAITEPTVQTDLIDAIILWLGGGIPPWLTVVPGDGTIDPSTTAPLTVTANSEGLENNTTYYADIHVNTANPDIGDTVISVTFTVGPPSVGTGEIPSVTKLNSNFPNPFGHSTTISFSLKAKSHVKLSVYNMRGQLVATLIDEEMNPANHTVVWNGSNGNYRLANGIYFYKLEADKKTFIKKMLLLR
ncbi:MAG: T9SS type A sorting domain-containing protein, partial [Candidatus Cloacimonadota bacterium]|nr:T9SS type A sorting domain-containing protein [Candidatus Cloacimonadota bacterium]